MIIQKSDINGRNLRTVCPFAAILFCYETCCDLSKCGPCSCIFFITVLNQKMLIMIQFADLSFSDNLHNEKQVLGRINQLIDAGMVDYPLYSASPRKYPTRPTASSDISCLV